MGTAVAVLIPAYKPDEKMLTLIAALQQRGFERLIAIDDGSGEAYAPFFERAQQMGVRILRHPQNRGKGAALKTGILEVLKTGACPVVTVDADGQHAPKDVENIVRRMLDKPEALVLGVRDKSQMPPRSKFGNTLTCWTLGAISGLWVDDTQTGLRGLPANSLEAMVQLEGDRYEYEMSMLLYARRERMAVEQVVIDTIYIDNNKSSSFRVLRDSVRIYSTLLRKLIAFLGSSAVTAAIEIALFTLLHLIYRDLLMVAVVVSRLVSSTVNYVVNKNLVFKSKAGLKSAVRYYALVCVMMILSYLIIRALTFIYIPTVIAKVLGDALLLVFNYQVQQRLVFRSSTRAAKKAADEEKR
jgi:glycosyltransferase involved in cell wall biosynthesis